MEDYQEDKPEGELNRIPIGATLYQQYLDVQEEYAKGLRISGQYAKYEYLEMRTLFSMISVQSQYPEVLKMYLDEWEKLNVKYGRTDIRGWAFFSEEAEERKHLIEKMMVGLGLTRMDSRPPPPQVEKYDFGYRVDGRRVIDHYWNMRKGENRNLNLILTGKVGGGKSYGTLSIANYMNRNYDLGNICYEISDFIDRIQSQPKGTVITLDEAGVSAGSKDTMSLASKSLSKTLQSTRYLQLISIFCVPNISYVDKTVRTMCDLVFTHEEGQKQGEFSVAVPELTEDGRDVELRPLKFEHMTVRSVYFPLPPPYLIQEYEVLRERHNKEQLSDLGKKLRAKKELEDKRGTNPNSLKNLRHFEGGN